MMINSSSVKATVLCERCREWKHPHQFPKRHRHPGARGMCLTCLSDDNLAAKSGDPKETAQREKLSRHFAEKLVTDPQGLVEPVLRQLAELWPRLSPKSRHAILELAIHHTRAFDRRRLPE